MTQTVLLQPLSMIATLNRWNIVRGIANTYDVAAEVTGGDRSGYALPSSTPDAYTISDAGVLVITPEHLADTDVELDDLEIDTDQGSLDLPLTFRDWFPSDSPVDLYAYISVFRSYDHSARELWRGQYWYSTTPGGNLSNMQSIIVSSADNGYLDLDALLTELTAISNNGLLYVTQLTDQIDGNNLVASADHEPLALAVVNGAIHSFTIRKNGRLLLRGRWTPSDILNSWSGTDRDDSELRQSGLDIGGYWGIVSVQEKYNGANNRIMHFGDDNSYPGIRLVNTWTYKFNTNTPSRPENISIGSGQWFDAHVIFMETIATGTLQIDRRLQSARLENSTSNSRRTANTNNTTVHNGGGMELDFGDFYWSEGMIWDLTPANNNTIQAQNYAAWLTSKNTMADNLSALLGNRLSEYDLNDL